MARGRIADRLGNALLLYGILELGIGLLAILSFFEIQFVQKYIIELQSQVKYALTFFTINFFITLAIILPSTILIGGTLPVMVKFLFQDLVIKVNLWDDHYGINTLGAVLSSLMAPLSL